MTPWVRSHTPGPGPQITERPADEKSLAQGERTVRVDQDQEHEQERNGSFGLWGWVFLGSIDHDGEEVYETICCRRRGGTGRING
jgi:hypothetical protein